MSGSETGWISPCQRRNRHSLPQCLRVIRADGAVFGRTAATVLIES